MTTATRHSETVAFTADDGLPLKLRHVWISPAASRGPVMLVHGAGNRGETFDVSGGRSIVDALLMDGWDVWSLDWRASKSVGVVPWTLADGAKYDHPAAMREVIKRSGASRLKVVSHCVGSASVAMAAVGGLLPDVSTVVTNGFSLHPIVPALSRTKLRTLVPLIAPLSPYVSPEWGNVPDGVVAHVVRLLVRLTHRTCADDLCGMVSFIFGSGSCSLWAHENLSPATAERLRDEFGAVPLTFFREIARAVRAGNLLPTSTRLGHARFVLLAGQRNRCFLPESQAASFRYLRSRQPQRGHALHLFPGYGHLDLFIGRNAEHDVFPTILSELAKD